MVLIHMNVLVELQGALRDGVAHRLVVAIIVSYEYRVGERA